MTEMRVSKWGNPRIFASGTTQLRDSLSLNRTLRNNNLARYPELIRLENAPGQGEGRWEPPFVPCGSFPLNQQVDWVFSIAHVSPMNARSKRGTSGNPSRKRPTCHEGKVRKDLQEDQGEESTKQFGPYDQRGAQALQFVLELAPPDTDWDELWRVYKSDRDPRDVWGNRGDLE